jgi:hypothetical protein
MSRSTLAAFLAFGLGAQRSAAQPGMGGPQKLEPPKYLSDSGKDIFMDVFQDENVFGNSACEGREKLLKELASHGKGDAVQLRAQTLLHIGTCEFKKGNYKKAATRYTNAISEMNAPSEDSLLQRQETAHIPLMRQASDFLSKHQLTEAATASRRCRVILERNLKKVMKQLHKQLQQQEGEKVPPLSMLEEEVYGYGKTGQMLPGILKQIPQLKPDLQHLEVMDIFLDTLDKKMAVTATSAKGLRERLDVSRGKRSDGVLLYVKGLVADAIISGEYLFAAQELESTVAKEFIKEAATAEKGLTLLKRSKKGSGCKDMTRTCETLATIPDVQSNAFGESRLIVVKAGKKQQLDMCTTNANVGIVMAAKAGAKVTVGGTTQELEEGKAVVVDFCQQASLEADTLTPVLFAQAWHPEFAAIERTTELRIPPRPSTSRRTSSRM